MLKSTLSSLLTYYLSLFTISKVVATRLECIQRNFLWGSSVEYFKYPLVAWEKVCLLRELGGLGIRNLVSFNQALLGKWLWRYGHEITHLWRRVIAMKYGEGKRSWCTRVCKGAHGCGLWRSISEGWEILQSICLLWWEIVLIFFFGMINGLGMFLLKFFILDYFCVQPIKKLVFLKC